MATGALKISNDLSLPAEAVTETFAILAKRGAGKTYTAAVLVEELADAGMQFVVVDPIGVWWGLRSSADGKEGGIPVVVLGGDHGDVPLEVAGGSLVADLVVDEGLSVVLDLGRFRKGEQIRFMTDFAERLYHRNRAPLHLVLDEADAFAPQKPRPEGARLLGAIEDLVRRGRARGIGVTLVTQRSAVLNKDVLTQAEVLVALRTTHPRDRDAIEEWAKAHGTTEQLEELRATLAGLPIGEAWFWSPGWLDVFKRVQIRTRRTFDSSATPKVGEKPRAPKKLADVDLDVLRDRMAATIEKAKADDPAALRKTIAELRKELAKTPTVTATEQVEVPIEVPAISEHDLTVLRNTVADLGNHLDEAGRFLVYMREAVAPLVESISKVDRTPAPRPATAAAARPATPVAVDSGDVKLGKGERTVLGILAEYPDGRTHNELAFLAGYSAKASTLGVILATLRRAGLVEPGQPIRATAAGLEAAGGVRERPTGDALLQEWLRHPRMGEGERRVLLALVDQDDLTHDELCQVTGYSPSASTIGVILSKLRKLGLVEKGARRIAPEFREAISA